MRRLEENWIKTVSYTHLDVYKRQDYHSISQAQQARGVELGKNEHFFSRLKNSVNILLPLILTSLNRIDTISNAMEPVSYTHLKALDRAFSFLC